jgi:hypothetical protein
MIAAAAATAVDVGRCVEVGAIKRRRIVARPHGGRCPSLCPTPEDTMRSFHPIIIMLPQCPLPLHCILLWRLEEAIAD